MFASGGFGAKCTTLRAMAKTYRPYVPEQDLLLPPSLRDWLPEGHLAFFVSDLVEQLDLSAILRVYEDDERGYPPYHPVMLTKVLVYGYCVGVFSSRRIQRRLVEDVAFRVLAAGNQPDFRTIADFRKRHLAPLQGFFEQVLRLARALEAIQLYRSGVADHEGARRLHAGVQRAGGGERAAADRRAGRDPAEDRHARRADDAKAPDEGGRRGLRQTQDDRRTGTGTNQAGARLSPIPACAASRRSRANGRWCAPRTTSSNCIACARDRRRSKGRRAEATHHRQLLPAARDCSRNALSTMTDTQPHAV